MRTSGVTTVDNYLSKLTETLYLISCSVEVKAWDCDSLPGTISPDRWKPEIYKVRFVSQSEYYSIN